MAIESFSENLTLSEMKCARGANGWGTAYPQGDVMYSELPSFKAIMTNIQTTIESVLTDNETKYDRRSYIWFGAWNCHNPVAPYRIHDRILKYTISKIETFFKHIHLYH